MSKAVKTTLHPDVQMINQYQDAQKVIAPMVDTWSASVGASLFA